MAILNKLQVVLDSQENTSFGSVFGEVVSSIGGKGIFVTVMIHFLLRIMQKGQFLGW
jgi:hypothetical protein